MLLPSLLTVLCLTMPKAVSSGPRPGAQITKLTLDILPRPTSSHPLPVVIWHGLGDSYKNPGITQLSHAVTARYPGTSVYLIHLAERADEDQKATWFGAANAQVEFVCKELEKIEDLEDGFDAIGLSQGGQLMRAYVERCNRPQVRNLITMGAQHMGVSEYPPCRGFFDAGCHIVKRLISTGTVYSAYAQDHIIPAQYFRDQADLRPYFEHNRFLRDINNERENDRQPGNSAGDLFPPLAQAEAPRNQTYKRNMLLLKNFVMFNFSNEEIVRPAASAHFGVANVSANIKEFIPLEQLPMYEEDYIGLRQLDKSGRIAYRTCQGLHMVINEQCWADVLDWVGGGPRVSELVIQT